MGDSKPLLVAVVGGLGLAVAVMWPRLMDEDQPETSAPLPSVAVTVSPDASAARPAAAPSASDPATCPAVMVFVQGLYCPFIAHRCVSYLGADPEPGDRPASDHQHRRCERYRDELVCEGRPAALAFCIDKYEYPNLIGAKPVVMVDYRQAKQACVAEGKRLCEAEEWVLACEGSQTLPYTTGLEREPGLCNIDRRPRTPNRRALTEPHEVSVEVERLDQRVPSGALVGCVSPFGVIDTTGNVAEWVHYREGKPHTRPFVSAIAGGHWGRVAATCRGLETRRKPSHRAHHTGFRCCADPLDGRRARRLLPVGQRLPRRRKITK